MRGEPAPARRRDDRPLPAASRRPGHADRGDRRRAGRARRGGQGPLHRPLRGARRRTCAAPPRCTRSRASRASTRCSSAASRAEVLDTCEELGIGFLPFAPLVRGLLAGSLTPERELDERRLPRRRTASRASAPSTSPPTRSWPRGRARSPPRTTRRRRRSRWRGCSAAGPWIVPIPGTKRVAYLEDNAGAPELELSAGGRERASTAWPRRSRAIATARADAMPTWVSPPLPA